MKDILNFLPADLSLTHICTFVIPKFSVTQFQGSFRSVNSHYGCADILAAMVVKWYLLSAAHSCSVLCGWADIQTATLIQVNAWSRDCSSGWWGNQTLLNYTSRRWRKTKSQPYWNSECTYAICICLLGDQWQALTPLFFCNRSELCSVQVKQRNVESCLHQLCWAALQTASFRRRGGWRAQPSNTSVKTPTCKTISFPVIWSLAELRRRKYLQELKCIQCIC